MDVQENKNIEIQIKDIIDATRIMEFAIAKGIFTVKELVDVAPIVDRFQQFSAAVIENQEKQKAAEQEQKAKEAAEDKGDE